MPSSLSTVLLVIAIALAISATAPVVAFCIAALVWEALVFYKAGLA